MNGRGSKHYRDPVESFFARTKRAEDGPVIGGVRCLLWMTAKRGLAGYGSIQVSGRGTGAHRFAYETFKAPIPDGMCVLHKCDNPPCCEIAHLFLGTQLANVADRHEKGRTSRATRNIGEAHPSAVLSDEMVMTLRRRYAAGGITQKQLADEYGLARVAVVCAIVGDTWKHLPVLGPPPKPNRKLLTDEQVREIRCRRAGKERLKDIGRAFGVPESTICNIMKGKSYAHVAEATP